jgi:hypothetical protein
VNTYKAQVKVSNVIVNTFVFAEDVYKAKLLLQQQYGKTNVMSAIVQVK